MQRMGVTVRVMVRQCPERGSRNESFACAQAEAAGAQKGGELCGMQMRIGEDGAHRIKPGTQTFGRIGDRGAGRGAARGRGGAGGASFAACRQGRRVQAAPGKTLRKPGKAERKARRPVVPAAGSGVARKAFRHTGGGGRGGAHEQ